MASKHNQNQVLLKTSQQFNSVYFVLNLILFNENIKETLSVQRLRKKLFLLQAVLGNRLKNK